MGGKMTSLAVPRSSDRPLGRLLAYGGALLYLVFLAAVHVAQPHMIHQSTISKYALGHEGWLIQAAFVAAGVGFAGIARLLHGWTARALWLVVAAFVVMGIFKIDSVGPNKIATLHGALHTIAFFVVVLAVHPVMLIFRRRTASTPLRMIPLVAPFLVVAGFVLPGLLGAILFRAWTLSLVAWVILAADASDAAAHADVVFGGAATHHPQ
jgi:hypothetical protein